MKIARLILGVVLLSIVAVSCRTVEPPKPPDEPAKIEWTVAAYKVALQQSMAFCEKWGLVDDYQRCEEELRRVEQENTVPDPLDPAMENVIRMCRDAAEQRSIGPSSVPAY